MSRFSTLNQEIHLAKLPQVVLPDIFAFPPNRDTLGATAYLILEKDHNILIDAPAWNETNQGFIQEHGGIKWLYLTHRGAIGQALTIQKATGCTILIQEQEAYLLPEATVTSFADAVQLTPHCQGLWTPGHSPGSSCLYYARHGGVLFTGRHLLPDQLGHPVPLRTAKTFHWQRQLKSLHLLQQRFTSANLAYILPGANIGLLHGQKSIHFTGDWGPGGQSIRD